MRRSGETVGDQTFSHLFETAAHSHYAFSIGLITLAQNLFTLLPA